MKKHLAALALLAGIAAAPAWALDAVQLAPTFSQPVFLTAPTGDSRLFVVEKGGRIQVVSNGVKSTYLDISNRVDTNGERGLLGLAFDPGFASNGRFYVNYIDKTTLNTVVAAFTAPSAASNVANAASEQNIITIAQPAFTNHKGGWIGFRSTDPGRLYIATGDGGDGNDPFGAAQDTGNNLGKILRITPSTTGTGYAVPSDNPFVGAAGNDEIWSYGLRNPYRNSFDRQSGDFWIADVGQDRREEINLQSQSVTGGQNYGWRAREGFRDTPGVPDPAPPGAIDPIFDYSHNEAGQLQLGASIIGGYVYRGTGEAGLDGSYFFGDFVSGRIFTIRAGGNVAASLEERTADLGTPFAGNQLSSFGEDGQGNLYAVGFNGKVFRIASAVPEPESWGMLLAGLGLLAAWRRQQPGNRA